MQQVVAGQPRLQDVVTRASLCLGRECSSQSDSCPHAEAWGTGHTWQSGEGSCAALLLLLASYGVRSRGGQSIRSDRRSCSAESTQ
eukprot:1603721-Amphidinium_carterae.1